MAVETTPRDLLYDSLVALRDSFEGWEGLRDFRARLMIAGAHLDDPAYIEVIESLGGLVVADLMCTGLLTEPNTIQREKDPLTDIAAHGLKRTSCPRMIEDFKTRVRTLIEKAEEFSVDGIVIQYIKFCDLWGIEKGPLVSALREAGIPVLCLEREYKLTGVGQMRTRVQAFLESMGR